MGHWVKELAASDGSRAATWRLFEASPAASYAMDGVFEIGDASGTRTAGPSSGSSGGD